MTLRIRYTCPHCKRRIVHHPELAGQLVICSACKGEFYEPTDPLPGKPAEQALQAISGAARHLRVPEGNDPKHDLAVLARRDASDLRTITEIVEAILLDDAPPKQVPPTDSKPSPAVEETIQDFGYISLSNQEDDSPKPAIPSWEPPTKPRGSGPSSEARRPTPKTGANRASVTSLAGPPVRPLVPSSAAAPASVVSTPQSSRSVPKPGLPVSGPPKVTSERPLAGISVKQMTEELRRRGLGVALVTCDIGPMRNFELAFSDNMTREDAVALLRNYLDTLRTAKPNEKSGLLKRMWKKDETE